MLLRWCVLLLAWGGGVRGQLLSNEDHPPLVDRLLQVVWEPSSLIRWWTALDQMYNVALGWRRAARSIASLPFQGRAMEEHVTFQAPRWSKRKADQPHWERFKKVYEPYLPDVPEPQPLPEFLFRPQEVFLGGLNLKDLEAMASGHLMHERKGAPPPSGDLLGLLQAVAGKAPFGSVNMADLGTLASFIDYKSAHSGQGFLQRPPSDVKALAAFAQKHLKEGLVAPDLKAWEKQKHFPQAQKGPNRDYLKAIEKVQVPQNGGLNDYLKAWASVVEKQKHIKDLVQAQSVKEVRKVAGSVPPRGTEKIRFLKVPDVPLSNPLYHLQQEGGGLRFNAADLAQLKSLRPGEAPSGAPLMFFGSTQDPQVRLRLFLNLMQKLGKGRANPVHFDDSRS